MLLACCAVTLCAVADEKISGAEEATDSLEEKISVAEEEKISVAEEATDSLEEEQTCDKNGDGAAESCAGRQEQSRPSIASLQSLCTIDVVHVAEMNPERFGREYYLQKPVIVTGVPVPQAAENIWDINYMRKNYGSVVVGVGSSRTITKMGGTGRIEAKLGDVIETMEKHKEKDGDLDMYAFDRDSKLFNEAPELLTSVQDLAATVFGEKYAAQKKKKAKNIKSVWSRYFSLGGLGSGVHSHHHGDGWAYVLSGRKRWFFHNASSLPRITYLGFISMRHWYSKGVYPHLRDDEKPLECVQGPGDLVYVPEAWWHATLNEGVPATLSFAAQRKKGVTYLQRTISRASDYKDMRGMNKKAIKLLRKFVKKNPINAEAWYMLGILYGRDRKRYLDRELEAKWRSYNLTDGRNCDVVNNFATALIHNQSLVKAERLIRDAIELCEWDDYLWSNLASVVYAQGRQKEALEAKYKSGNVSELWTHPIKVPIGSGEILL